MNEPRDTARGMDRIRSLATPRATGVAVLLYLVSVAALTASDARLADFSNELTKLDLRFGYDHAAVLAWLAVLGESGRGAYLWNLAIDSVMPVAFAAATVLVVARAAPRWLPVLAVAPVTFLVLDLMENVALAAMVATFPDVPGILVAVTSPVTMIKLSAFAVALPTLIITLAALGVRWVLRRR